MKEDTRQMDYFLHALHAQMSKIQHRQSLARLGAVDKLDSQIT